VLADGELLRRIDMHLDATVRDSTDPYDVGPMRVFVSRRPWPYYARPRAELDLSAPGAVQVEHVRAAAERLEAAGAPAAFEWIGERVPSMADAVAAYGQTWTTAPLQAMGAVPMAVVPPDGAVLRLLGPDDDAVVSSSRVLAAAFGSEASEEHEHVRRRLRLGLNVTAVAEVDGEVVSTVTLQPLGAVGELVGGGTLHAYRRRGLISALIRMLVDEASRRGVELLLLSATDDGIRAYEQIGFRTVATLYESPPD